MEYDKKTLIGMIKDKAINKCEEALAKLLGRRYCVGAGNATAALSAAYSLMGTKRNKVLLPAMMCLNPVLAVYYAKKIPVFADVLETDATIDPRSVEYALQKDRSIGAVLAVHLFGHPADMDSLAGICAKHKVLLIEDLAQAMGGVYSDGALFGSKGDCSIVSFGYSKIIDIGNGGALLADNNAVIAKAGQIIGRFGVKSAAYEVYDLIYKKLFYAFWEFYEKHGNTAELFDLFPEIFKDRYLYRLDNFSARKIVTAIKNLKDEVLYRQKMWRLYREELSGLKAVKFFEPRLGYSPWRFSFRVDSDRRPFLLSQIRAKGFDISSWYPCVGQWYCPEHSVRLSVAQRLSREVVNLWVSRDYNEKKAISLVAAIKKIL